jgi:hypothetical protein
VQLNPPPQRDPVTINEHDARVLKGKPDVLNFFGGHRPPAQLKVRDCRKANVRNLGKLPPGVVSSSFRPDR